MGEPNQGEMIEEFLKDFESPSSTLDESKIDEPLEPDNNNLLKSDEVVDPIVEEPAQPIVEQKVETAAEPPSVVEESKVEDPTVTLREELAKAYAMIQKLQSGTQQVYPEGKKEEKPVEVAKPAQHPTSSFGDLVKKLKEGTIFTQEELDEVIDKPEIMNVAISRKLEEVASTILGVIPRVTEQYVQAHVEVSKLVTDFYQNNQDLIPFNQFVQSIVAEKEKEGYNTKTYKQIFDESATEARKRLRLEEPRKEVTTPPASPKQQQPAAFAGSKRGGQRPAAGDTKSVFDENAADLMNLIP